jgi:serine/threonine-protein kinase
VTVYDVGRDDEGAYMVMELIDGPSLATSGPELDRGSVIEIGAQIADALGAVHATGMVHRDVKPANILLADDGTKLADFGIAVDPAETSRITQPGKAFATPGYAAPEVLAGQAPTPKSDIFSLAVILYDLLAGRPPFQGTDRSSPPPPLDDTALDRVLGDALARDPGQRPDAVALAAGLRDSIPTRPIPAGGGSTMPIPIPVAPTEPAMAAARTTPRWTGLVGIAAVIGTLVIGLSLLAGDTPAPAAGSTPTAITMAGTATTVPTTVATTVVTSPPTTVDDRQDAIHQARSDLEAALAGEHPRDLNPNDQRDILRLADEAIELTEEGKTEEAAKKLREVAKKIDKDLEDASRDAALGALVRLADALGLSLDGGDDGDDD